MPIEPGVIEEIDLAAASDGVLVSAVSAWEIGILVAKGRLALMPSAAVWMARFLAQPGVREVELAVDCALRSSFLPGALHGDPADRMLVATARELGCPIVTRDRRILDYARAGHVEAIPC